MGYGSFDRALYTSYASATSLRSDGTAKSINEVFVNRKLVPSLDPKLATIRESRDSADNPLATPVILALDVTGSMGMIPHYMIKEGLGKLMEGILESKTVTDPHLMFMAVGDVKWDTTPLQVSQFEADIRIAQQLTDIYVEGKGGGNNTESYNLPWYFASTHTSCDAFEKRNTKGFIFTFGDEMPPEPLTSDDLKKVLGPSEAGQLSTHQNTDLINSISNNWEVFHLIVEQGSYARTNNRRVVTAWRELLGKRAIQLSNYEHLSEVVTAIMKVAKGADPYKLLEEYPDAVRATVDRALFGDSSQ